MVLATLCLAIISSGSANVIREDVCEQTEVIASWYGAELQGHKMANGEKFDRRTPVVAHRDLPLGTKVHLTNPTNGKSADGIVKDRGPYVRNRRLDVSEYLAKRLGFKEAGTATLLVAIKK